MMKKLLFTLLLVANLAKAADTKLSAMTPATTANATDLVYLVTGVASPSGYKITLSNLLQSIKAQANWGAIASDTGLGTNTGLYGKISVVNINQGTSTIFQVADTNINAIFFVDTNGLTTASNTLITSWIDIKGPLTNESLVDFKKATNFNAGGAFTFPVGTIYDGGLIDCSLTNYFRIPVGVSTNLTVTNISIGQILALDIFPTNGTTVTFLQQTNINSADGIVKPLLSNSWNRVYISKFAVGETNFDVRSGLQIKTNGVLLGWAKVINFSAGVTGQFTGPYTVTIGAIATNSGGGSQTPWTADINGAGFNGTNIGRLDITGAVNASSATVGGITSTGSGTSGLYYQQASNGVGGVAWTVKHNLPVNPTNIVTWSNGSPGWAVVVISSNANQFELGLSNIAVSITSADTAFTSIIYSSNTLAYAFKTISAGSGVTLTDNGTNVIVTSSAGAFDYTTLYMSNATTPSALLWSNNQMVINGTNLANTSNYFVKFTNSTPAASGAQQEPPPLIMAGNAFNTTGSTSQPVSVRMRFAPAQGTTPTAAISWDFSIGAQGVYSTAMSYSSGGTLSLGGGASIGVSVNALSTSYLGVGTTRGRIYSSADSLLQFIDSNQTNFTGGLILGSNHTRDVRIVKQGAGIAIAGGDGGYYATNHLYLSGSIFTTNGHYFPSNSVSMPAAAALGGAGGYWIGNSNGILVSIYTTDGSTTIMKQLVP